MAERIFDSLVRQLGIFFVLFICLSSISVQSKPHTLTLLVKTHTLWIY